MNIRELILLIFNRLTSKTLAGGHKESYTYDANGNRTSKTLNGVPEIYSYDSGDKMLSAGNKTYSYDAAGRTKSVTSGFGAPTILNYDDESRLTSVTGPTGNHSYTYNGLDTRMSKNANGNTTNYHRDGAYVTDPVIWDSGATYTPGISERRSGTTTYTHGGMKDLTVQTGSSGATNATRKYDAFGMVLGSTGTWKGPFGYSGSAGYQEDETGLQLLGHRYYDSSTGRFLTRDPIKDGRNWYAYCDSNPVTRIDADGLLHIDITLEENGLGKGRLIADPGDIIGYYEVFGAKIPIIALGGEVLHEFDVSNRCTNSSGDPFTQGSNGPYPPGSYGITDWDPSYTNSLGGYLGSTIFTDGSAPTRRGTWIHTGRGEDYTYGTQGCIRLRQSDMNVIFKYLNMNKKGKHRVNVKQKGKRSRKKQSPRLPIKLRDPQTRM